MDGGLLFPVMVDGCEAGGRWWCGMQTSVTAAAGDHGDEPCRLMRLTSVDRSPSALCPLASATTPAAADFQQPISICRPPGVTTAALQIQALFAAEAGFIEAELWRGSASAVQQVPAGVCCSAFVVLLTTALLLAVSVSGQRPS